MQKAEVYRLKPYFLSTSDAAAFLGIAKKTLANELSAGTFPVKPIRRGSKPLFPYAALLEYARALENKSSALVVSQPWQLMCEGLVNGLSIKWAQEGSGGH